MPETGRENRKLGQIYVLSTFSHWCTMISADFLTTCIALAQQDSTGSPTTTAFSDFGLTQNFAEDTDPPSRQDSDFDFEAHSDYYGLPSNPVSVYHTGNPWKRPTGPEAQRVPKEARPICEHPIADVWDKLGRQVVEYLDSVNVMWTSIDPVRFAEIEKEAGPIFLWVGVKPGSLSRENAKVAAVGCKKLLQQFEIADVEVAFRESLFTRLASPSKLFNHVSSVQATADVRSPLTPALGLQIAARAAPHFEGTGGIFICEGGKSKRVFLLTARHVLLPPNAGCNKLYSRTKATQPRRDVLLLGRKAYQNLLESIMVKIGRQALLVVHYEDELEDLGEAGKDDKAQAEERKSFEGLLKKAQKGINTLNEFHSEVTKYWSAERQRVLGHIAFSPPISVGTGAKLFTEDWALIELHDHRIDWEAFKGNVIDLGTKIPVDDFMLKMYPHPEARATAKYPRRRLLQLRDVLKESELRHPTMRDANGEPCLIVVKSGSGTGVTLGRATGILSFVREYLEDGTHATSTEVAIYAYGHKDGAFSAPGDSGSVIADGKGCVVGLLTGGAGQADSIDVTYATPYYWLSDERIKAHFPDACLYPIRPRRRDIDPE